MALASSPGPSLLVEGPGDEANMTLELGLWKPHWLATLLGVISVVPACPPSCFRACYFLTVM